MSHIKLLRKFTELFVLQVLLSLKQLEESILVCFAPMQFGSF